ncbi:prohibitin family protein [Eubacteriales bacterium OttesenSCG-928-K08]|nr:prohibitin family protein [Eubacteriales bacterium OttesenSCG-928-K08]
MFKKKDGTFSVGKVIAFTLVLLVIVVALLNCFVVIPAGDTGVVVTMGKISDIVLQEGLHFKNPVQQVVRIDNHINKLEVSTQAFSKDLQTVTAVLAVNYRVDKSMSHHVYKNVGLSYEEVMVVPAVHEVLKAVVAQYTASTLVSDRSMVSIQLDENIKSKLSGAGIVVEDLNIIDWDFSDEYIAAIEQKQVAEQNLIRAETEKSQKLVQAQAEAEATLIEANAQAEKLLIEAESQAEYNTKLSETLSAELIEYMTVEKWDGKLPQVQSGSSSPLIGIDLDKTGE